MIGPHVHMGPIKMKKGKYSFQHSIIWSKICFIFFFINQRQYLTMHIDAHGSAYMRIIRMNGMDPHQLHDHPE